MPSKYAYNLGATRGKGSSTRMYNYCLQTTSNQFACIQQFITIDSPSMPTVTPSAPTITSITPGLTRLTVIFTAPTSDGGSSITNYQYSTNNGTSFTSAGTTTSPITITGLTNGTTYQVIIRAVNSVGNGTSSNMESATTLTPSWSALASGTGALVRTVAIDTTNNYVYYGGNFTTVNSNVSANYVARWNPTNSTWSALTSGLNGITYTLALDSSLNLYAGSTNLYKWNGTLWTTLVTLGQSIQTISVISQTNIIIGGWFSPYVKRWNGTTLLDIGSGVSNIVLASTYDKTNTDIIYVGCASGPVLKWNGTSWSSVGTPPFSQNVNSLALDNTGILYAGGDFGLYKWNGTAWSIVGSAQSNNSVLALYIDSDNNLYVGGSFTSIGGISANRIAKWNGTSWSALGSGLNDASFAVSKDLNDNVYIGGLFTTAGGNSSNYVAKYG